MCGFVDSTRCDGAEREEMVVRLLEGVATFGAKVVPERAELFAELAGGQSPDTLLITCADSRIDPSLITQTEPGDLFVIRNAGNIVPRLDADGTSADGTAGSIEFAVAALRVEHIVVCGHSSCGAMVGLADPASLETLPSVARWLEHSEVLCSEDTSDLDDLIERNVLLQLEHLATYPAVRDALNAGTVELHAWVYDIGSGVVRVHNGERFVPSTDRSD